MSGYILNREGIKKEENKKLYRKNSLELMTTHQLREICRREKIIQGLINPMDKEELVSVIMRYRGTREELLIHSENKEGRERLAMDENDKIHIPFRSEL